MLNCSFFHFWPCAYYNCLSPVLISTARNDAGPQTTAFWGGA